MNDEEQALAEWCYEAIQEASSLSERSLQSAEFRFGVSDLGWCAEKSRRMLDRQVPGEEDYLSAFIGTAIGDHFEQAVKKKDPTAIVQSEVEVFLQGETREYQLTGHPDIILPGKGLLLDGKTRFGLGTIERTGPSMNQQYQRHCYALGAHQAGYFGERPLEEVQVGNVWIDRSAQEKRVHVQVEPYDPEIVRGAGEWLDSVVYAYLNNEEAAKEPPREVCAATCGFFSTCRAFDTDVEGRLTDPTVLAAVEMVVDARAMETAARLMKSEAQNALKEIVGTTGTYSVRWIHVNETEIRPGIRRAHDKLEVRKL